MEEKVIIKSTHINCKYFLATDVFKGICKQDKTMIAADDECCEKFTQVEKCRHCMNYTSTDEYLGKCMNKTEAYPDMIAKTCEDFKWNSTKN